MGPSGPAAPLDRPSNKHGLCSVTDRNTTLFGDVCGTGLCFQVLLSAQLASRCTGRQMALALSLK